MSISEKISVKEIIATVVLLAVFAAAMWFTLGVYRKEGEKRSADISDQGEKDPNHIQAFVKILTIDPVKGDITARIEFEPEGNFADAGGNMARPVKFYVNSANGKQETEFQKGKRMTPVEVVINMYDGNVSDYPFDVHKAFFELYFEPSKPKPATDKPATETVATPAPKPVTEDAETEKPADAKPTPAAPTEADDDEEDEISLGVDFYGSIPGYQIIAAKGKESDDSYVTIDVELARSGTVKFFSIFVAVLMWVLSIGVLLLVASIVFRGRKPELAMFSFMAALLFAFSAVRNSQPNVPPLGTFSDFISFFWAEIIIALCLLTTIFVWLFRPVQK